MADNEDTPIVGAEVGAVGKGAPDIRLGSGPCTYGLDVVGPCA
ncbi:hypothetical protein PY650_15525 [Rhizobium calliandrae]|uniref:Uncharacterized protein n=1 Tax=Rhizobium calliandrae TaxID=1312182 RepID=A0ABT7KEK0_9HYPH|nr:hypothetical protein [Rhizobium calliandrae]